MKYPMRCPECGYETESQDVPIEQGPPPMGCLNCAMFGQPCKLVLMRRVFVPVAAIFRGGGWASKS